MQKNGPQRSDLESKVIIDKNGKLTTVYVRKSFDSSALTAAAKKLGVVKDQSSEIVDAADPRIVRSLEDGKPKHSKAEAREHQEKVVSAVMKELKRHDRTTAIAACGSGKTVMAQQIIKQDFEQRVAKGEGPIPPYVFVTKGISLTEQSLREFDEKGILGPHLSMTYHSESRSVPSHKRDSETNEEFQARRRAALAKFMEGEAFYVNDEGEPVEIPRVIFVTYESANTIAQSQEEADSDDVHAPIMIMDEAHHAMRTIREKRVTSDEDGGQVPRVFLNSVPGSVQAKKRVMLTATPVLDETQLLREGHGGGSSDRTALSTEQYLQELAMHEDDRDQNPHPRGDLYMTHENEVLAGRTAAFLSQRNAVKLGILKPVEQKAIRIPSRVGQLIPFDVEKETLESRTARRSDNLRLDPMTGERITGDAQQIKNQGVSLSGYSALHTMIAALDEEDAESPNKAHNALLFLAEKRDLEQFQQNWKSTLLHNVPAMSEQEAWSIVDSSDATLEDRKAAKRHLLAQYSSVAYAHAESTPAQREAALNHFSSGNDDDRLHCKCGRQKQGKWCACKRIVANCKLFADGIDVQGIDTVVVTNPNGATAASVNQMLGRSSRKYVSQYRGEKSSQMLVPVVTSNDAPTYRPDQILAQTADRLLECLRAVNADKIKARLMKNKNLEMKDTDPVTMVDTVTGKRSNYKSATAMQERVTRLSKRLQRDIMDGYMLTAKADPGSNASQRIKGQGNEDQGLLNIRAWKRIKRDQVNKLVAANNAEGVFKAMAFSPKQSLYRLSDLHYDMRSSTTPFMNSALQEVNEGGPSEDRSDSSMATARSFEASDLQRYVDDMRALDIDEKVVGLFIEGARRSKGWKDVDLSKLR